MYSQYFACLFPSHKFLIHFYFYINIFYIIFFFYIKYIYSFVVILYSMNPRKKQKKINRRKKNRKIKEQFLRTHLTNLQEKVKNHEDKVLYPPRVINFNSIDTNSCFNIQKN